MASKYIILWHGTSKSRADSIAKTGFYRDSFFTRLVGIAWGYASARRKQDDPGVLVLCAIDLNLYTKRDYQIRKGRIYHFVPSVPRDAVAGAFRIDRFSRIELENKANLLKTRIKKYKNVPREPEIVITRNCGAEGIAYWINTYLSAQDDRRVDALHPGIKQIRKWVEKNYANGRISPISDREMLMQAKRYVPELSGNIRAASARV